MRTVKLVMTLTFKEMLRKRIFVIGTLLSVGLFLVYGLAVGWVMRNFDMGSAIEFGVEKAIARTILGSQLIQVGLYLGSMILAFTAMLATAGAVAGEVETGTILALAAQPVARAGVVLGKFCGSAAFVAGYATMVFIGVLGLNAAAGNPVVFALSTGSVLKGLGLFIFSPVVLVTVILLLSCLLPTIAAGITGILLYGLSLVGNMMESIGYMAMQAGAQNMGALESAGIVTSLIVPVQALGNKMVAELFSATGAGLSLAAPTGIFWGGREPSASMIVYTVIYVAAALWGAITAFKRKLL